MCALQCKAGNLTLIPIRAQLGPSMREFLSTCWEENRGYIVSIMLTSGVAAALTVAIAARHACLIRFAEAPGGHLSRGAR